MNNTTRVRKVTLRESTGRFSTIIRILVEYDMHGNSGRAFMNNYRQYLMAHKALGKPYDMPTVGQDADGRNIRIDY